MTKKDLSFEEMRQVISEEAQKGLGYVGGKVAVFVPVFLVTGWIASLLTKQNSPRMLIGFGCGVLATIVDIKDEKYVQKIPGFGTVKFIGEAVGVLSEKLLGDIADSSIKGIINKNKEFKDENERLRKILEDNDIDPETGQKRIAAIKLENPPMIVEEGIIDPHTIYTEKEAVKTDKATVVLSNNEMGLLGKQQKNSPSSSPIASEKPSSQAEPTF